MLEEKVAVFVGYQKYELIEERFNGWNDEAFLKRYSDILSKYDYIVGDWGYEQLRLRGFYRDEHPKATHDTKISTLPEYLFEYCNFGCAYFVLKKVNESNINI
ncbi:YutD family protein [Camelliibacillus cellulosilyticus]|uniref:YutD family protein n=1 Tax=Camelliibacillus cellulosilyticus TaxID=2174486 RepID=A0ABV9GN91_9BACL